MKIKMRCTIVNKVNGLYGPFVVGVEYDMSDENAAAFVASGLAEYSAPPAPAPSPVYETTMLTDQAVIETPEDAAPQAFIRAPRWKK